ncbi:MAG: TatD family hydrolase [Candidatus Omnitrophota bacterium]|nr:TatD family hydrolase [Candidatus Omnitrophota bacterium]
MLVDTHAHLDFSDFDPDRKEIIQKAAEAGVKCIINVSSDLRGCLASLELTKKYENIFAAIGIHPHGAAQINEEDLQRIPGFLKNKKVVAVGEVGLDYYRNLSPQDKQRELFSRFIGLSLDSQLPLIIHSREAEADTLTALKSCSGRDIKGVIHCFSGSRDFCQECLDLGLSISFTCNVTYKKSDALRELVKYVPSNRLLLETDCPYLSPEGLRGKRNEPANVRPLAQFIADLRGCSFEEIAKNTSDNAISLFKLE